MGKNSDGKGSEKFKRPCRELVEGWLLYIHIDGHAHTCAHTHLVVLEVALLPSGSGKVAGNKTSVPKGLNKGRA